MKEWASSTFPVWETARARLIDTMSGEWCDLLEGLHLDSITEGPEGSDHYHFSHPLRRGEVLRRLRRRVCAELLKQSGRPATLTIRIAPPPSPEEPPATGDDLDSELMARVRHAARSGHGEQVASWGVRNRAWCYYTIGAYEALFWGAYLGVKPFRLWDTLRAWAESGRAWPSLRTLAECVVGHRTKTAPVHKLLARLRDEGLLHRREVGGATEYYVRRELPLLTPHQVARLSPMLQKEHRAWLQQQKVGRGSLLPHWTKCRARTFGPPPSPEDSNLLSFRRVYPARRRNL